jgi:hypothetical protein
MHMCAHTDYPNCQSSQLWCVVLEIETLGAHCCTPPQLTSDKSDPLGVGTIKQHVHHSDKLKYIACLTIGLGLVIEKKCQYSTLALGNDL